jgi:hypothetical protein
VTFIVAAARQQDGVGGHIELASGQTEAFIELSPGVAGNPDAVLAALAHEVTHKFLHARNVSLGPTELHHFENEILTDVASVYLGFGCLLLNGYETSAARLGYLTRDQLAAVHVLVNFMRRMPPGQGNQGLNTDALAAVRRASEAAAELLDVDRQTAQMADILLKHTQQVQSSLADADKELRYVQRACCDPSRKFINSAHSTLFEAGQRAARLVRDIGAVKTQDCLSALGMTREIRSLATQLEKLGAEVDSCVRVLSGLASRIAASGPPCREPEPDEMAVITCPYGCHDIHLQTGFRKRIRCSRCGRDFLVDSTPATHVVIEEPRVSAETQNAVQPTEARHGVLQWLFRRGCRSTH